MKTSRVMLVAGASATMLAVAFAAAPKELAELQLGEPQGDGDGLADNTFEGPAVSNLRGIYQLRIVVDDGVVSDVVFVTAGTSAAESVGVNGFALPELRERILAAQTWDVEHVSGASYTSPAMIESAQGAFEAAGL